MRILPVNCICYQSKTNNYKPVKETSFQQNPLTVIENSNFNKNVDAITLATALGVVLSGAALAFSAPLAMVAGALILAPSVAILNGSAAVRSIADATKPILPNLCKKI